MTEAMAELALCELLSLECRVCRDGTLRYYNALGELHRVHGPAVEYSDGDRAWYHSGQRHRLDGPAVEFGSDVRKWYIDGDELTESEWQQAVASMETV
jgi:hypothetical protein